MNYGSAPNFPTVELENERRLLEGVLKKYKTFGVPTSICSPALAESCIPMTKEMYLGFINLAKQYRDYVYKLKDDYGFEYFSYPSASAANLLLHQIECCMFDTENKYTSFFIHELDFGETEDEWSLVDEDGESIEIKTPEDLWNLLIKNICSIIRDR